VKQTDIWLNAPAPPRRTLACRCPIGHTIDDRYRPHEWAHTLADVYEKGSKQALRSLRSVPWFFGEPAKLICCLSADAAHLEFWYVPNTPENNDAY